VQLKSSTVDGILIFITALGLRCRQFFLSTRRYRRTIRFPFVQAAHATIRSSSSCGRGRQYFSITAYFEIDSIEDAREQTCHLSSDIMCDSASIRPEFRNASTSAVWVLSVFPYRICQDSFDSAPRSDRAHNTITSINNNSFRNTRSQLFLNAIRSPHDDLSVCNTTGNPATHYLLSVGYTPARHIATPDTTHIPILLPVQHISLPYTRTIATVPVLIRQLHATRTVIPLIFTNRPSSSYPNTRA